MVLENKSRGKDKKKGKKAKSHGDMSKVFKVIDDSRLSSNSNEDVE